MQFGDSLHTVGCGLFSVHMCSLYYSQIRCIYNLFSTLGTQRMQSTAFALETYCSPFCTILKECFQKETLKYDTDKILPAQKLVDLTVISITIQCTLYGPLASPTWQDLRFTRIPPVLDLVKAGFWLIQYFSHS